MNWKKPFINLSSTAAFVRRLFALNEVIAAIEISKIHIDPLPPEQKVGGSNPPGRTTPPATKRIMSDVDRLHEIIDALPPQQVHALLTLLAPPQPISDEEFARRLAMAPEEEIDEGTTARIFAAEAEHGEIISHGELKQRLGL